MNMELDGKTVFIGGASRGIGFGMARAFLREGAKVALTGRGEESLAEAEASLRNDAKSPDHLTRFSGDLTQSEVIAAALDHAEAELGPIHTAVANVGLGKAPLGFEITDELWEGDIAQNLTSAMYLGREALRRILARPADQREGANLIMIASIAGMQALGSPLTYGATKAGLIHATRALAKVVGKEGVRVNAIAPGNILFEGGSWEKNMQERPEAWTRWINREVALRRFGTIDEIGDAALFLASPRASFITGECLVVDGGQLK